MVQLNDCHSLSEVFDKAGLEWLAEEIPILTADGKAIESHKAVRREDTGAVLGVVGRKYRTIQDHEAFAILDLIASRYRAVYRTAGLVDNGRRVVIQAQLGNCFDVTPGDVHSKYLTAVNSFDGSMSAKICFTAVRLHCMNQLHASLRNREFSVSIKHSSAADERIHEALRVFNLAGDYFLEYKQKAQALARKLVDKSMVRRFLDEVIGEADSVRKQNQRDKVEELFTSGRGNHGSNAYDLLNGLTEWVDHYRNEDDINSKLFGSGAALKEKAFETALAL